jgi:hypothetical protein
MKGLSQFSRQRKWDCPFMTFKNVYRPENEGGDFAGLPNCAAIV